MGIYNELLNTEFYFDNIELKKNLIIARKSKKEYKIIEARKVIFFMLNTIILKKIDFFYNLLKNSGIDQIKIYHTKDDVAIECYIILNNCINKFEFNQISKFVFYYNKSLLWGLRRILDNEYLNSYNKKNLILKNTVNFISLGKQEKNFIFLNKANSDSYDDIRFYYYEKANLSNKEKLIAEQKYLDIDLKTFLKINNISKPKYYKILENLKRKMLIYYKEINF